MISFKKERCYRRTGPASISGFDGRWSPRTHLKIYP